MIRRVTSFTKLSVILLLLSTSGNSFAGNYHSRSSAYKYIPIGIAIGYLAHRSYNHKAHHSYRHGKHYRGYNKHYTGKRYSRNRYYGGGSYGHKRYYSGKRYYGNRYYGKRPYGHKRHH